MKIAVFCGSSHGNNPRFTHDTKALGEYFAQQNIELVYGGGNVGLMGEVADAVLASGGVVHGVMPKALADKELAHPKLTSLYLVNDMHERKAKMAAMCDAFVALPGGAGTLEEIFEAWTWAQLMFHVKPCAFYNTQGFYEPLFTMVEKMSADGFIKREYVDMLIRVDQPASLLEAIRQYKPPKAKWS